MKTLTVRHLDPDKETTFKKSPVSLKELDEDEYMENEKERHEREIERSNPYEHFGEN